MTIRSRLLGTHLAIAAIGLTLCACGSFLLFWVNASLFLGDGFNKVVGLIAARYFPAAGLVVLGITAFGGVWMGATVQMRLASQLAYLRKAAAEIRDGNLGYELAPGRRGEFDELVMVLEQMRVRLKDTIARMQAVESERRSLMANICHDLKTPVTSIVGYAEGILDGVAATPEKVMEYAGTIHRKAKALSLLIADLSLLSVLENAPPLTLERVNLGEILRDFARELGEGYPSGEVQVELACAEELPCMADRVKIERVLTNLAQNSLKYGKTDGRLAISISAESTSDSLLIRFADNGPGISADKIGMVFERFYRADPSRTSGGSGLGLAIVKQIVQLHKGKIWMICPPGGGLTVNIQLPKQEQA